MAIIRECDFGSCEAEAIARIDHPSRPGEVDVCRSCLSLFGESVPVVERYDDDGDPDPEPSGKVTDY